MRDSRSKVSRRRLALLSACVEEKHADVRTIKNDAGKVVAYFVDLGDGRWTEIAANDGQPREKRPVGYTSSMTTIREWEDEVLEQRFRAKLGVSLEDVECREERAKIRREVASEEAETFSWTVGSDASANANGNADADANASTNGSADANASKASSPSEAPSAEA